MRQITQDAAQAWLNGKSWRRDNTAVNVLDPGCSEVLLHGHRIASRQAIMGQPLLTFTLAGYQTRTTCERVNGLMREAGIPARIYQRKYQMYISYMGKTLAFGPDDKLEFWSDPGRPFERLEIRE
jgi:hypothetical protein